MVFWGAEVKPGEPFTHCGEDNGDYEGSRLHLSQATLGLDGTGKERTVVKCKVGDGPELLLCSLTPGVSESCSLNLMFDQDVIFSVTGSTSVHLVGYFMPLDDEEDDDYTFEDSEDEDDDYDYVEDEDSDLDVPAFSGVKIEEIEDEDEDATPSTSQVLRIKDKEQKPVKDRKKSPKKRKKAELEAATHEKSSGLAADLVKEVSEESEDEDGFALPDKKRQARHGSDITPVPSTASKESTKGQKEKKKKTEKDGKSAEKTPHKASKETNKTERDGKSAEKTAHKAAKENGTEEKFQVTIPARNGTAPSPGTGANNKSSKKASPAVRKFPNGLEIEEISMGKPDARPAKLGKRVSVFYTGKIKSSGKIFDSNIGKKPFSFRLGVGEVIKGWDVGVAGMRIGDKRRITVPAPMGYGAKGVPGTIPGNSTLVFDVEVIDVAK